ncbi:hypothetical protein TNCT_258041 [Trichonephila clavata]|uniref:Uncharacterized protein n=1 Tax=Trichonephila clavata TaxID=2740835 RepID=A0A8X6KND0_TRICU|nr:hypothetical protein TNCT_258041 [Trichonephila clavata]
MIRKLHLAMTTVACKYEIVAQKFKEFCLATTKLYVAIYLWYYMPRSLRKVLIHESLLVNDSILPIGQMSEEAIEAWKNGSKYFHPPRKFNWQQSMEDTVCRL